MEVKRWVLWVMSFVVLAQILGIKCCVREEREALLNLKAYVLDVYHNDPLVEKRLSSWVTDDPNSDCCRWDRVTCHVSSGRVSEISLQALNYRRSDGAFGFSAASLHNDEKPVVGVPDLPGLPPLPPIDFSLFQSFKEVTSLNFSQVLANLSNLEVLILKSNNLIGSLPFQDICKLKKIRVLDFSHNAFNGSLNKCLANLTSLQALDLSSNVLSGEIPASAIASLTSLEYFSAMSNYFKGIFPLSSFTNNSRLKVLALQMYNSEFQVDTESEVVPYLVPLFQLQVLDLANCKVNAPSGTFPSFLLYQHDLHYLDLSNNDLFGAFPNWLILNNTNLTSLILHHNKFTGSFELPTYVDQPPPLPLTNLQLSDNKMEGQLPTNIGLVFLNFEYLNVSGTGFSGGIPPSIANMSNLIALDLSRNRFYGQVPESFWEGCASLTYLILSQNNLEGNLFASQLNSSSLRWFFLDSNYLSGTLEHETWNLPNLDALDISNNSFWGRVPTFISSSYLRVINLSRNNFTGTPPREFCKLDLLHLQLSHNKLSGSIPACYLNIDLSSLQLQGNFLSGSIPTLMRTGSYLVALDLRDNDLSGVIPDGIFRMNSLRSLLLGGNQLQGQLPSQLCQPKMINFLDLSRNNFTGNIPTCFDKVLFGAWDYRFPEYDRIIIPSDSHYQYAPLQLQLFFEQNQYFMTAIASGLQVDFMTKNLLLPYKGNILRFMSGIDLSSNQLTGKIPQEIGYLESLHALNLSHNNLNGSIPESFHNLADIESIDLSNNNLEGEIPIQLQDLNFLGVFNVSYNNLSGTVPNGLTFDDSSFIGNHYLIWNHSNRGNSTHEPPPPSPLNNDTKEDESAIDFISFIWSLSACYVAVLVIMATVLWINPYWRRLWFYYIDTCLYRCLYPYLKDAFW
ncbi:receptor-like protein 15 [Neltuma alba]|uniref:receptor-like protein 15 n=1 Tax=Neltuma alba TaxID=207710 RepID=UPI0010A592E4|nr:receptor-like protein 15 [Prosopis alba]